LHNPIRIEVSRPATTAATVRQLLVASRGDPAAKRETLRRLLRSSEGFKNAILFCNRKREVAVVHRSLLRHGFNAVALHGDMDQPARMAALDQFRRGEASLLVASDVAARGLDIPEVSHVINFDVPHHADDYVHRVGRTGRAGKLGTALTIVTPTDRKAVEAIEKLTGQTLAWSGPKIAEGDGERRERSERGERPDRRSDRKGARMAQAPRRESQQPAPAKVARLDEARSRRRAAETADTAGAMHLPAFLLRPVRVKA